MFPARGEATAGTSTEIRHRSLFTVPVYHSDVRFQAAFDLAGVGVDIPSGAELNWSNAELLVGVADPRGAQADATAVINGQSVTLTPASVLSSANVMLSSGGETQLTLFGARAADVLKPGARFDVSAGLKFTGAQRLAILAFAKSTDVTIKGDWPHPSFEGGFLPSRQAVSDSGFEAQWTVPFIARGVPEEGGTDVLARLGRTGLGVSFVALADPYQSVTRSLKYAVLFIGLVFLSYFLFEVAAARRVHPAQYILVGIAQLIFYLLLLSIAERLGFDFAFAIAASATVLLISAYAGWIFASRRYGLRALGAFGFLYALIYLLLRLEDDALLVGAIASFTAIAAVMYFTRRLDWYSSRQVPPLPPAPAPAMGGAYFSDR
jgi:inner membrane protein